MDQSPLQKNLSSFLIIFSLVILSFFYPVTVLAEEELETKFVALVVLLDKEIILVDYFFEILVIEGNILIPLRAFSEKLGLNHDYLQEMYYQHFPGLMLPYSTDFDPSTGVFIEHPPWGVETQKVFEGDLYVSPEAIEFLTEVLIDWNSETLELSVDILDIRWEYIKTPLEQLIDPRPPVTEIVPEVVGPDFSIGSIQYTVGVEYKWVDEDEQHVTLNQMTTLHGRAGDWAFSLRGKGDYGFSTGDLDLTIPMFRLRYTEGDQLIVIGDSRVFLGQTLGRKSFRGFLYQFPEWRISSVRAFTSISGEARPGDTVTLFVNERRVDEIYIFRGEQSYNFKEVSLIPNRTNNIRIEIRRFDGEIVEIEKQIPGSPNILEEGVWEYLVFLGRYGGKDGRDYKGDIVGQEIKFAITDRVTGTWEIAGLRDFDSSGEPKDFVEVGNVMGLAFWPFDVPLLFSVDWLAGGMFGEIAHGVRSEMLYTLEKGYFEVGFSYVPPPVTVGVRENSGFYVWTGIDYEISQNYNLSLTGELYRPIWDMEYKTGQRVESTVNYRDGRRLSLGFTGAIGHRFYIDKGTDGNIRYNDIIDMDLIFEHRSYTPGGSTRSKIGFLGGYLYPGDHHPYLLSEIILDLGLTRNLADNFLIGGNISTSAFWLGTEFEELKAKADARARITASDNLIITATGLLEGEGEKDSEDLVEPGKIELGLAATYYFSRQFYSTGEVKYTRLPQKGDAFYTSKGTVFYNNPDLNLRLSLRGEYLTPTNSREEPQIKAGIGATKTFSSGLGISLDAARTYRSSTSVDPEYTFGFSINQTIGFAGGNIFGQRHPSGTDHVSFIAGVVYLDENGNGIRDKEEPLLSDITILLDRRRDSTDGEGMFFFERIGPGLYEVGIDPAQLPKEYQVITPKKVVQIRENENIFLEFGVIKSE